VKPLQERPCDARVWLTSKQRGYSEPAIIRDHAAIAGGASDNFMRPLAV
jgi:hypothetical protein